MYVRRTPLNCFAAILKRFEKSRSSWPAERMTKMVGMWVGWVGTWCNVGYQHLSKIKYFHASFIRKNCFGQFLAAYFFLRNSQLKSDVCRLP